MAGDPGFLDDFDVSELNARVWLPHYLPQWSSRAESAATYALAQSELRLTIPPGLDPHHGRLEVRARMEVSPRSMAAVWMVGLEDEPTRCAEICVFEVFGDALERDTAAVGMGVHPFRDPALTDEWAAERVAIDVSAFHVYAADWRAGRVDFLIDGEHVKTVHQAPEYPMQMMVAVFDFPDHAAAAEHADHVPGLAVDWIRGSP